MRPWQFRPPHRVEGVDLDYGVASLSAVDNLLARLRDERLSPEQVDETVFSFGAYSAR